MVCAKSMTRQLKEAMDAYADGKITKAEYDALAIRLQDKAMRLNELGIMSDAVYHRFEDVWATGGGLHGRRTDLKRSESWTKRNFWRLSRAFWRIRFGRITTRLRRAAHRRSLHSASTCRPANGRTTIQRRSRCWRDAGWRWEGGCRLSGPEFAESLRTRVLSEEVVGQGFDLVVFPTDKESGIMHNVRRREERRIRPRGWDAKGFRTTKGKRGAL